MTQSEVIEKLKEPFPYEAVGWKPKGKVYEGKIMVVAFIDARDVMSRLDETVGAFNWESDIKDAGGHPASGIGIRIPETHEWTWKWAMGHVAGEDSEKDDEQVIGVKGTDSDGLKRAGVVWGIGRYLYDLPKQYVAYDEAKKRIVGKPTLPAWALPKPDTTQGGGQVAQKFISEKGKDSSPNATESQTEAPKPNGNGATHHPVTLNVTSPSAPVLNLVKPPIITNLSDKKYQALIANSVLFKLVPDNKNLTNMFAAIDKAGYPELTDENVEEVWKKIKPVTGGK